jgi:hypothetical protein
MFIENGSNFLSVDMNAHIFIWQYNEEAISSKVYFEPTQKQRLNMSYDKWIRQKNENKMFPEGKEKEFDPSKPLKGD